MLRRSLFAQRVWLLKVLFQEMAFRNEILKLSLLKIRKLRPKKQEILWNYFDFSVVKGVTKDKTKSHAPMRLKYFEEKYMDFQKAFLIFNLE